MRALTNTLTARPVVRTVASLACLAIALAAMPLTASAQTAATGPLIEAEIEEVATGDQLWDDCRGDDPDTSVAACTTLLQDPTLGKEQRLEAMRERAAAYNLRAWHALAIADLNQLITANPNSVEDLHERATAYLRMDQPDRALADLNRVLTLQPDSAGSLTIRGYANLALDRRAAALADFEAVLRADAETVDALVGRGMVLARNGEHGRAIADYTQALELDAENVHALFQRSLVYMVTGQREPSDADRAQADEVARQYSNDWGVLANYHAASRAFNREYLVLSASPARKTKA